MCSLSRIEKTLHLVAPNHLPTHVVFLWGTAVKNERRPSGCRCYKGEHFLCYFKQTLNLK